MAFSSVLLPAQNELLSNVHLCSKEMNTFRQHIRIILLCIYVKNPQKKENQHISMISEGSWSFAPTGINHIFKYIKIECSYCKLE